GLVMLVHDASYVRGNGAGITLWHGKRRDAELDAPESPGFLCWAHQFSGDWLNYCSTFAEAWAGRGVTPPRDSFGVSGGYGRDPNGDGDYTYEVVLSLWGIVGGAPPPTPSPTPSPTPTPGPVPLLDRMIWSAEPECPLCSAQDAVGWAGGSINTRNGNLSYQETDLSIPVQGSVLEFRRS